MNDELINDEGINLNHSWILWTLSSINNKDFVKDEKLLCEYLPLNDNSVFIAISLDVSSSCPSCVHHLSLSF